MPSASDLLQLWQVAPWLAVGLLALAASAWVYRQTRRLTSAAAAAARVSATRQGERLGALEKATGLLDLRRRQVEWELLELGVRLPHWPPDGPDQPRPRPMPQPRPHDEDQDDDHDGEELLTRERRVPVPPLDPAVAARHRRP